MVAQRSLYSPNSVKTRATSAGEYHAPPRKRRSVKGLTAPMRPIFFAVASNPSTPTTRSPAATASLFSPGSACPHALAEQTDD